MTGSNKPMLSKSADMVVRASYSETILGARVVEAFSVGKSKIDPQNVRAHSTVLSLAQGKANITRSPQKTLNLLFFHSSRSPEKAVHIRFAQGTRVTTVNTGCSRRLHQSRCPAVRLVSPRDRGSFILKCNVTGRPTFAHNRFLTLWPTFGRTGAGMLL